MTTMEVRLMLSTEMLALLGGGAVLPYLAEALWSWQKRHAQHRSGATSLDSPQP